ncbi:ribulose-bisphosphate carboxylase large subunit [Candidatus Falkowbacteria bacterium]|nr:ribulose-bisphosphate carboxylase large subunit [Candidatus Falkowbacteria bacterium]
MPKTKFIRRSSAKQSVGGEVENYYLHLGSKPSPKEHIIATYRVESRFAWEKVATEIAAETSIGTWTQLSTLKAPIARKLAGRVFNIDKKKKLIKIAYPLALFEKASIPQLLSGLAGNVFSLRMIKNIRLEDLDFPQKYLNNFGGPAFGRNRVKYKLRAKNRPLIGAIMKPKIGLSASENARLAYRLWVNGADIVKDDENLTNLDFNQFKHRVEQVLYEKTKAQLVTKKKKMYVFNVTATPDVMMKRAKIVERSGGKCVMVDIISVGLDNVQMLRKANLRLIIHGHRAGHSAFTRNPRHGISYLVIAKLARMAGVDQLHTGTVVGKMADVEEDVLEVNKSLTEKFGKFKPTLPIASGGLHPGLVPNLVKILGKDIIINFGGGIHGHPSGSSAGARAASQAVEAVVKGKNIKAWANKKDNKELKQALEHWGS